MERDFIKICLKKWRWFVASVVSALVLAIVFLLWTTPKYERTASVLIRDEAGGVGILSSAMGNMGMLAGMAGLNIASDVNNEMAIFSSPSMMKKVMNRLEMDTKYEVYEGIRKKNSGKRRCPSKLASPN